ncbi:MAG: hypothetical protein CHACPFDD_02972 [Phycisphaerae bacterium]|nr:hypothetical protein [Phycisphaerae bacterium]
MNPARAAPQRIQKFLSDAGVASRRAAEELVLARRVLINDQPVTTLPTFVRPGTDRVIVDGVPVRAQRLEYFIVHKPAGVVCTQRDPAGRTRSVDLLPPKLPRLFPVGRLEADTEGLLILTNDGELANRIAHPRYGVEQVYCAELRGRMSDDLPAQLLRGVYVAEGHMRPRRVDVIQRGPNRSVIEIELQGGRRLEIRRAIAMCGHKVRRLTRVRIGPIELRGLPAGAARRLTPAELRALKSGAPATPPSRRFRPQPAPSADAARPPRAPRDSRAPRATRDSHAPRAPRAQRRTRRKTVRP